MRSDNFDEEIHKKIWQGTHVEKFYGKRFMEIPCGNSFVAYYEIST